MGSTCFCLCFTLLMVIPSYFFSIPSISSGCTDPPLFLPKTCPASFALAVPCQPCVSFPLSLWSHLRCGLHVSSLYKCNFLPPRDYPRLFAFLNSNHRYRHYAWNPILNGTVEFRVFPLFCCIFKITKVFFVVVKIIHGCNRKLSIEILTFAVQYIFSSV